VRACAHAREVSKSALPDGAPVPQVLAGEHGIVAEVWLPEAATQATHDRLHLDFALGCPGPPRPRQRSRRATIAGQGVSARAWT